jgi:hypothetical protein
VATEDLVFISYAREDREWAERLYMDLRKEDVNAWLDIRCLAAGANWKIEIRKAIRSSRHFVLLLSRHSVTKRGFVQKEIKEALDVLRGFPTGTIYLIPARLDKTEPVDEELQELNWVDLAPNYQDGLARILSALATLKTAPLVVAGGGAPTAPKTFLDRGREVVTEIPLILGPRAAINYTPFRTRREFLQQFFDRLPTDSIFADNSVSYYILFDARRPDVLIGDDLKEKYPERITVVLQNVYRQLQVLTEGISVVLAFDGVERIIAIPYAAILQIGIREIGVVIVLETASADL